MRASAARTRQPIDSGDRSTSHDEHDGDNYDPTTALSLASLLDQRVGICEVWLGLAGFLCDVR
jgi:hypothetical protein